MAWFKKIYEHFELPGLVGLFAFISLGFMALNQHYTLFGYSVVGFGVLSVLLACYNTHRNKSIELLDRYEERFFIKMKEERKLAAQYLLGQKRGSAHFKYVIDFLDSPVASKTVKRQVDVDGVYEYFSHWIQLYWQAGKEIIQTYHEDDPGAWPSIKTLYDMMVDLDKKKLKDRYNPWTPERLKSALEDEASL